MKNILEDNPVDIILGDFNMNYFNDSEVRKLKELMETLMFKQIVQTATFISGSLLDHVYVNPIVVANAHSSVVSVYYSDHEAIKISLNI